MARTRRSAVGLLRWTGALLALAAFAFAPHAHASAEFPYPYPDPTAGDTQVHDPMMLVRQTAPRYMLFSTGDGIATRSSTDRVTFTGPVPVFPPGTEPWWWPYYTSSSNPDFVWGPDVSFHNGKYWMYYAASYYLSPYDAIGLATSTTGLPGSWQDQGVVITSDTAASNPSPYEAIGPNLNVTSAGQWYLTFGTHGIWQVALDPNTGKRPATAAPPPVDIAEHTTSGTEAPFVYRHGGYYYLFTSWGSCCTDRANTTYNVRVARSASPTGPYTDRSGVAALNGGGTLVLEGHDWLQSTGHSGVFFDSSDNLDHLTYHYYDKRFDYTSYLGMNTLNWTEGDWPYLTHDYGPRLPDPYRIFSGDYLTSQNGAYTLKVQLDCNLVERRSDGAVVWSSGTNGLGTNCRLVMNDDGKLSLYNGAGDLLWTRGAAGNTTTDYRLVMQNDGNLVVYTDTNQVRWSRF